MPAATLSPDPSGESMRTEGRRMGRDDLSMDLSQHREAFSTRVMW